MYRIAIPRHCLRGSACALLPRARPAADRRPRSRGPEKGRGGTNDLAGFEDARDGVDRDARSGVPDAAAGRPGADEGGTRHRRARRTACGRQRGDRDGWLGNDVRRPELPEWQGAVAGHGRRAAREERAREERDVQRRQHRLRRRRARGPDAGRVRPQRAARRCRRDERDGPRRWRWRLDADPPRAR